MLLDLVEWQQKLDGCPGRSTRGATPIPDPEYPARTKALSLWLLRQGKQEGIYKMREPKKIAISADGPDLDAKVENRFSDARYLLIIDVDTGEFEALPNPVTAHQRGAGVHIIALAFSKGAKAIATGYCSPDIGGPLKSTGIEVITGMTGTARDALERFRKVLSEKASESQGGSMAAAINKGAAFYAARNAVRQIVTLLPVLIGVVLLIGLFNAFISRKLLTSVFSGNVILDTLAGACLGSVFAGNPIHSYVIGGELLTYHVSLYAVTAFLVTWVTVGLVQLPAEIEALGKRFALLRNGLSFVLAIVISILTTLLQDLLGRG